MTEAVPPVSELRTQPPRASQRARHVLVVEDESPIRAMLAELLQHAGYAVIEAGDGREALHRLREQRPDLIILDLMLPRLDGWTFLRQRQDDPALTTIPVLVISAAPQQRLLEAKELGADAFLSKPFDLGVLNALVRSFAR